MATFEDREKLERDLARALGKLGADVRKDVLALLGDPPDLDKLTAEVWAEIEARYSGAMLPKIEQAFMTALQAQASQAGVAFAFDLANDRAIEWARQHTFDLVRGINDTSRRRLATTIEQFYNNELDFEGVLQRVGGLFGPERASTIAVTEITRAATGGAQWYNTELQQLGIVTEEVWETADDDVVCPVCGPRDGRVIADGVYPPAHPNCRCWVSVRPVLPETEEATA